MEAKSHYWLGRGDFQVENQSTNNVKKNNNFLVQPVQTFLQIPDKITFLP
jgi:hypothetical protein